MGEMSKSSEAVLYAYEKGYRVDPFGNVLSPSGSKRKLRTQKIRNYFRLYFTVGVPFGSYPVRVSRLAAYQKYGMRALAPDTQVRHLNGNSLDNSYDNIAIGSQSENMMDRSIADRAKHAQWAGLHRSDSIDWGPIDTDRSAGMSYNQLAKKYQISKSSLSMRYRGNYEPSSART